MFRLQRSARAKNGKVLEAYQFAKQITDYINNKYSAVSLQFYAGLFGDVGNVYWIAEYKDLTTLEGISAQLLADQGYQTYLNKVPDLFIEGSVHDILMRSL